MVINGSLHKRSTMQKTIRYFKIRSRGRNTLKGAQLQEKHLVSLHFSKQNKILTWTPDRRIPPPPPPPKKKKKKKSNRLWRVKHHQCRTSLRTLEHFDGVVQDCRKTSALAMELLQSCTKPSIYFYYKMITCFQMFVFCYSGCLPTSPRKWSSR